MKYDALLIAGPTAGGKSALALQLARTHGGVIVNADSMQVYAEAPILTAQPSATDRAAVPHLLYGHVSVHRPYSTGEYARDAALALEQARAMGKLPIFTGGTGLYFTALTDGLAEIPPVPDAVRRAARALADEIGPQELHRRLAARDPATAARLRPTDPQRVTRAWEVLEATGTPLVEWQARKGPPVLKDMRPGKFVLDLPRPILRQRIADRFAAMVDGGGLEEARALAGIDPSLPAAKLLGLRALQALAAGTMERDAALARAITDTHQFAKRQMTWFRGQMADYSWIATLDSNLVA